MKSNFSIFNVITLAVIKRLIQLIKVDRSVRLLKIYVAFNQTWCLVAKLPWQFLALKNLRALTVKLKIRLNYELSNFYQFSRTYYPQELYSYKCVHAAEYILLYRTVYPKAISIKVRSRHHIFVWSVRATVLFRIRRWKEDNRGYWSTERV